MATVLDAHPFGRLTVCLADGHHESVHAIVLAVGFELRKHGHGVTVARGVANPFLARRHRRAVDHERPGFGIVGCGGFEHAHVRAVAGFGHGEATQQLQRGDIVQIFLMMFVRAQKQDAAAKQAELNAEFHDQAQVEQRQCLEQVDEGGHVVFSADGFGYRISAQAVLGQHFKPAHDRLTL